MWNASQKVLGVHNIIPKLHGSTVSAMLEYFSLCELSLEWDTHVTGFNIWQWFLTNSVSSARHRSNRYVVRHPDDRLDDTSEAKSELKHMRNGEELILSPGAICKHLSSLFSVRKQSPRAARTLQSKERAITFRLLPLTKLIWRLMDIAEWNSFGLFLNRNGC